MPRDGTGNFTLTAGNPVVPGTVIEAAWANPTLSDIAAALTDSLSRSGSGGMLVPFRNTDGAVGAPGMTWSNEPSSGWYRAGLNDFWYSVGNENIFRITKTGIELAAGKNIVGFTFANLNIVSGVITASSPAISSTQTWNNAAVTFIGADMNITDTASAADSLLQRWRVGGVVMAAITKAGGLALGNGEIVSTTVDGADNKTVSISGGGARASTRGAVITTYGNEHAVFPGDIVLLAGAAANGFIRMFTADVEQVRILKPAGATRYLTLQGSAAGAPSIGTSAGDLNLTPASQWVVFLANSSGSAPSSSNSGLSIGWNKTSGEGEVDFYSHKDGGTVGGFAFYDWNGAVATEMARFGITGTATFSGTTANGVFTSSTGTSVSRVEFSSNGSSAYFGKNGSSNAAFGGAAAGTFVYNSSGAPFSVLTNGFEQLRVNHTATANRYWIITGSNGASPTISTSAGGIRIAPGSGTISIDSLTSMGNISGDINDNYVVSFFNQHVTAPRGLQIRYDPAAPNNTTQYFQMMIDGVQARAYLASNGGWYNFSGNNVNICDADTKNIIGDLGPQRTAFRQLALKTGGYKDGADQDLAFVVAQNVEQIYPELVTPFDIGGGRFMKGVKEHGIQIRAYKVIQEHDDEIEALKQRVQQLENI